MDISYIWTGEGWLYLAVIIDLFARRVVSWAASDRLHKELALSALHQAIPLRRPPAVTCYPFLDRLAGRHPASTGGGGPCAADRFTSDIGGLLPMAL